MTTPTIDRNHVEPAYQQIVDWASDAIARGEIGEGQRLPAERRLASDLGVSRNTVVRAYEELAAAGLVSRHVGVGTVVQVTPAAEVDVSDPLFWRTLFPQPGPVAVSAVRELIAHTAANRITMDEVAAPPSLFPTARFRDLVSETIEELGGELLAYTDTEGLPSLRSAILERYSDRAREGRSVAVMSGATQGLNLLLRALVSPGDVIAVETPTFPCAISALSATGAQVVGIPVEGDGLRLDLLEQLLRRHPVKLLLTVPNFNNPTGVLMSDVAKQDLLAITRRHGTAVIADDVFGDLSYDPGPRPSSLIELEGAEHVIEVNSVSKVFGGGMRIGWVLGPPPVVERLAEIKQVDDVNTSTFDQHVAARVLRSGLLDDQIEQARPRHAATALAIRRAIAEACGARVTSTEPAGGMSLWCELRTGHGARQLLAAAQELELSFATGDLLTTDGRGERFFRLALGGLEPEHASEVARRLRLAIDRLTEREPVPVRGTSGTRALI